MLRGLHKLKFDVPIDPRTFLGTPRVTPIINCFNEMYLHFSLEQYLQRILQIILAPACAVETEIKVHGLPVQGFDANIVAKFEFHRKSNIIGMFERAFWWQLEIYG